MKPRDDIIGGTIRRMCLFREPSKRPTLGLLWEAEGHDDMAMLCLLYRRFTILRSLK